MLQEERHYDSGNEFKNVHAYSRANQPCRNCIGDCCGLWVPDQPKVRALHGSISGYDRVNQPHRVPFSVYLGDACESSWESSRWEYWPLRLSRGISCT